MTRPLLLLALACFALPAAAQYKGPAVEACRAYALKQAAREGPPPEDVVILQDGALSLDKNARKLGSQRVSAVLTGNGAVVLAGTPSAELSFICLLADEKRPLFFRWLPRENVSALAQCSRSKRMDGTRRDCLQFLLRVAETDLGQAYAERFQEAASRGEEALAAYRKANDEWKGYREAECARRASLPLEEVSPEELGLACAVEVTRQRIRDMRRAQ